MNNAQNFESPFTLNNDNFKLNVKSKFHNRRYTSDRTLEPSHQVSNQAFSSFLLPEIEQAASNKDYLDTTTHTHSQPNLENKWKNQAMLKKLDNKVK